MSSVEAKRRAYEIRGDRVSRRSHLRPCELSDRQSGIRDGRSDQPPGPAPDKGRFERHGGVSVELGGRLLPSPAGVDALRPMKLA